MRPLQILPFLLLVAGAGLIAYAVASGSATLFLVLVIPVLTGGSLAFVAGVVLLFAGFFTLPLAWAGGWEWGEGDERGATAGGPAPRSGTRSGGLILVGPVPIFFGGMRPASRRTYWLAVLAGLVLTVVVVALALALVR